jgi:hypothetical protein
MIFEILGLGRDPKERAHHKPALTAKIQQAMLDDDLHRLLRRVKKHGLQLMNLEVLYAEIETVEQCIDEICRKFERRFRRTQFVMPLKDFARFVTGAAKVTKDAVSVVENADKILIAYRLPLSAVSEKTLAKLPEIVQRCVDRDDGQDVGGEGERINPDAQAEGVDLSGIEGSGQVVSERPGAVVDRSSAR